jgi:peptidoglycan/xylan/chitin deacetylase (PgdA/CDA1 family)
MKTHINLQNQLLRTPLPALIFFLAGLFTLGLFWFPAAGGVAEAAVTREGLEALRQKNGGRLAQEVRTIHTTEMAVNFSFAGIGSEESLNVVLATLEGLGGKATFFVTERDIKRYPGALRRIVESGNEVAIATVFNEGNDFYSEAAEILRCEEMLARDFGVRTDIVKQLWGAVPEATMEAAAATGKRLVGQIYTISRRQHKDYASAQAIREELFPKTITSFGRGQQIFARLDFFSDPLMCAKLLLELNRTMIDNVAYAAASDNPRLNPANDSRYVLKTVGEMLNNKRLTYEYPVPAESVPPNLRPEYRNPKIASVDVIDLIARRYIGKGGSNDVSRAPGFSRQEVKRLDTAGVVHTKDNVIFLTFADWGGDDAINKLLYVLRKHRAPATFFVRTNNVHYNPNLLRAIAVEGHEIGSHTDKHLHMTKYDEKADKYVSVVNSAEYGADLADSYRKLAAVAGDVVVDGKHSLTRFFRPPTLVISKEGLASVFASGFEYVVMGNSTKDYVAQSYLKVRYSIDRLLYNDEGSLRRGTVLVLHMSRDAAPVSAEALDFLLTRNAARSDSDPGKFKVGRLGDYLKEGYDQSNPKKTLRLEEEAGLAVQN